MPEILARIVPPKFPDREFDITRYGARSGGPTAPRRFATPSVPAAPPVVLDEVFDHLTAYPPGFTPHPKLVKQFKTRAKLYHEGGEVEWATAEALAFGSLLLEGMDDPPGRRGHPPGHVQPAPPALVDYEPGSRGRRSDLPAPRAKFRVYDSLLSEYAADRLRVRLLGGQQGRARAVGGAVRRLRQRRPDHHRPVPRGRRGQVGPDVGPRPAAAPRLRGPGSRALVARIERFLTLARRGQHPGRATPRPRRSTSTCCGARCRRDVRKPLVLFTPKRPLR